MIRFLATASLLGLAFSPALADRQTAVARPASPPAVAERVDAAPTDAIPPKIRREKRPSRTGAAPIRRVADANRTAARQPLRPGFVNAVQVYPFEDGAVYDAYTTPGQVTDIALQPGETLNAVASGDTARWVIGDTSSGSGETRRTHILVKPINPGLVTNLVITTDRRSYHLRLTSTARTAMTGLGWSYPQDDLLALQRQKSEADAAAPVAAGVPLDALNFGYSISGDRPDWRPLRAFDDGRQTFIEFPAAIAVGDAPPLFVRSADGAAELVNYRMRGRFYIVDRLFAAAELRLGTRKLAIVRIERIGREPRRSRRGS